MNLMLKVSPDKERARSLLKTAEISLDRINETDENKFFSNIVEDYYDIIHKLIAAVLIINGLKASGENAHKLQIEYFGKNYSIFSNEEIMLINNLRIIRNNISYDGLIISRDYLKSNRKAIMTVITKLRDLLLLNLGK